MLFNFGKCKCIHIGHGNMDEEYKMGDAVLGTQEKDTHRPLSGTAGALWTLHVCWCSDMTTNICEQIVKSQMCDAFKTS